jgi:hypothetical protein
MRKIFPSQSAFFNPRVLLSVAVFSTSVFLALAGFAQIQRASFQAGSISGRPANAHNFGNPAGVPPPCAPPPSGMVGWWPGDGNADDISSDNYDGTVSGGVTFTTGKVNQAFTFNGTDGEVVLPNSSSAPSLSFRPNDSFTLDAWIKPDPSVLGTQRAAVSLTYVCSPESILLILLVDGKIDFGIRDSLANAVDVTSPSSILDDNWHHVTGVRDFNSHTVTLYLDGISVSSVADTTTGTFTRTDGQNRIGSIAVACPTNRYFWQGQIDEVEVFNRALSQPEIQSIVNAGSSGKCKSRPHPTPRPRPTPAPRPTS